MFTCSTCRNEWPENYCPVCAHTIDTSQTQRVPQDPSPVLVKSNVPESDARIVKPWTTGQKLSELTRCLRWFVGLFVLNILTFWGCLLLIDEHPSGGWVMLVGLATVGPLAIFCLYKLSRITGSRNILIYYSLFVLIPPTATVALILLCGRTLSESSRLGYRVTLFPPRITAGLGCGAMVIIGSCIVYVQALELWNHAQLKKSGQPTTGTLQMVTKHYVNFIPAGYTFTINYAGRPRSFAVNGRVYQENTLPDGKFTHHEIPLIYLPAKPDVAELPEMLGFSVTSLFSFLFGGLLVSFGGWGLYRTVANKPW